MPAQTSWVPGLQRIISLALMLRSARDTIGHGLAISRHDLPEVCKFACPSAKRGRRECRVRAAPAVSCAKNCAFGAHEHTGERRTLRHPLRNGFTAYNVLSPVSGLVVTVTCGLLHKLDASIAAPGPHDFAVRGQRFVRRQATPDAAASTASHPNAW
jgi:hypothetical protein